MFCGKCGSEIPTDAVFCENCGAPVEKVNVASAKPTKKSKKKVVFGLVFAIILVIAIGIAGFTYYDMKILPNEIGSEISAMKLKGYDKTIGSAMDDFFGMKYNWAIERMGGRFFVTFEGIAYEAKYEFRFWYDREPPNVDFEGVIVDGERLERDTDEYGGFT